MMQRFKNVMSTFWKIIVKNERDLICIILNMIYPLTMFHSIFKKEEVRASE